MSCHYCDRVLWGSPVYLGNGKYRHEACAPGSEGWAQYYRGLPIEKRTSAGDILLSHCAEPKSDTQPAQVDEESTDLI